MKRKIVVLLVVLFSAVVLAVHPPARGPVESFVTSVLTFPLRGFFTVRGYFTSKSALAERNKRLKEHLAERDLRLGRYAHLEEENARLRALLELRDELGRSTVSCNVIARSPARWLMSLTIDKGTDHGIKEGSAVIAPEGLVGRVSDARSSTSTVILMSHPSFIAGGMLEETGVHGMVSGSGEGEVMIRYLPLDADIALGETVLTSRYSAVFPEGISIGTVERLVTGPRGLSRTAYIEPSAAIYKLREVLCIIKE